MFERFTDSSRRIAVLAQEEARQLKHNYLGTEHLLLGVLHEEKNIGALALNQLGLTLDSVRAQIVEIVGEGRISPSGHIPSTPRVKKVLELSMREALQLGSTEIRPEHILLGLCREGEGVAAQVWTNAGLYTSQIRATVIQLLSSQPHPQPPSNPKLAEAQQLIQEQRAPADDFNVPRPQQLNLTASDAELEELAAWLKRQFASSPVDDAWRRLITAIEQRPDRP